MAAIYFTTVAGLSLIYGLSTDEKPFATEGSIFIERDSGNLLIRESGEWVSNTRKINVTSIADLPAPVAGVIQLEDATSYEIIGVVDIGTNRISSGFKSNIKGTDRNNDTLQGTGTGALITCDGNIAARQFLTIDGLTLRNVNGSILNFTSPTPNQSLVVNNCTFMACVTAGVINNPGTVIIRDTAMRGPFSANGFTFTGTGSNFILRDCNASNLNAGTLLNLGTAVFQNIVIGRNIFDSASGQTTISGALLGANITNAAKVAENIFKGSGTFTTTLLPTDPLWHWHDNTNIPNTKTPLLTAISDVTLATTPAQTQQALTDNSGGTAGTTIAVIAGAPALKDAIATLADQLARVRADVNAMRSQFPFIVIKP